MNDIQFEAFTLYSGMRTECVPKLQAFLYTMGILFPEDKYPNGYDDSVMELYRWLRTKVKLDKIYD